MTFYLGTGDLDTIPQICAKIHDIHDTLSTSSRRDASERVKLAVECSKQSLKKWQKTWLPDASDSIERPERLLEKESWVKVQETIEGIAKTTELLKDVDTKPDNAKVGRKPIWRFPKFGQLKKPQSRASRSSFAIDLALDFGRTIEWLWIHSEVSYDVLYGTSEKQRDSPARDRQLSRCVTVRRGAVALYEACQRSTRHCELELDLLSDRSMLSNRRYIAPSTSETSLFYHISVETANNPKVARWNITAQSLEGPEAAAM